MSPRRINALEVYTDTLMGIFDRFRHPLAGSPALTQAVQAYCKYPMPERLRGLYRYLRDGTVLLVLNQEALGVMHGALLTPTTGARVEFATTRVRDTGERVIPAFTDKSAFRSYFTGANRQENTVPHVAMRVTDLLPILVADSMGIELCAGTERVVIGSAAVRMLAQGKLPESLTDGN